MYSSNIISVLKQSFFYKKNKRNFELINHLEVSSSKSVLDTKKQFSLLQEKWIQRLERGSMKSLQPPFRPSFCDLILWNHIPSRSVTLHIRAIDWRKEWICAIQSVSCWARFTHWIRARGETSDPIVTFAVILSSNNTTIQEHTVFLFFIQSIETCATSGTFYWLF